MQAKENASRQPVPYLKSSRYTRHCNKKATVLAHSIRTSTEYHSILRLLALTEFDAPFYTWSGDIHVVFLRNRE